MRLRYWLDAVSPVIGDTAQARSEVAREVLISGAVLAAVAGQGRRLLRVPVCWGAVLALVWTEERILHWKRTGEKPSPVMVLDTGAHRPLPRPRRGGPPLRALSPDRVPRAAAGRGVRAEVDRHPLGPRSHHRRKQLVVDGWEVYEDDPKTDAGARTIALDSDTVRALKRHRAQQDKDREEMGERLGRDGARLHQGEP